MRKARKSQGAAARLAADERIQIGKHSFPVWRGRRQTDAQRFRGVADKLSRGEQLTTTDALLAEAVLRFAASDAEARETKAATDKPTKVLAALAYDLVRVDRLTRAEAVSSAIRKGDDPRAYLTSRVAKALDRLLKGQKTI